MKFHRLLAALLLSVSFLSGAAHAADDAANFLLTPALLNKMKAVEAEVEKQKGGKEDDDDQALNPKNVTDLARKLDQDKTVKAALAKHGVTSREMASATFAMLHAGMYVMFEQTMDKKKAAQLLSTYTKEQQANIALVRSMNAPKK
jgi:hypothetical protein